MTFIQALLYFFREGSVGLLRSWKISLVAVMTITVSLVLTGTFLLVGGNLSARIAAWQAQSRLIVYLENDADEGDAAALQARFEQDERVHTAAIVSTEEAQTRFVEAFPSMSDLLDGWTESPLPASLELVLAPQADDGAFAAWLDDIRQLPSVAHVDDDRDWLRQMEVAALAIRGFGIAFGTVLLVTSIFTIASVIRLTVYLYQEEIDVMRMVGATEFFIRGPFYLQGLLQGLLGGGCALVALYAIHTLAVSRLGDTVAMAILARDFLRMSAQALVVVLGGAAGLVGAIASLRREKLGSPPVEQP